MQKIFYTRKSWCGEAWPFILILFSNHFHSFLAVIVDSFWWLLVVCWIKCSTMRLQSFSWWFSVLLKRLLNEMTACSATIIILIKLVTPICSCENRRVYDMFVCVSVFFNACSSIIACRYSLGNVIFSG